MLHFFNCKKLKYIHDEPYALVDCNRQKITLKKDDVLALGDDAMYRSLKFKTRLFEEVPLKAKKEAKPKNPPKPKEPKDEPIKDEPQEPTQSSVAKNAEPSTQENAQSLQVANLEE